ncbi:hypothetical protein C7C56_015800 [Massilia glaciei]|uniref:Uncharacterized protein n=1 Tax=Massilia glaciei TaxID=1524097 RepID=A0A2U2HJ20_9BURK|nr:hypothetical protein C7C56_015800 [Massilia glaciei]
MAVSLLVMGKIHQLDITMGAAPEPFARASRLASCGRARVDYNVGSAHLAFPPSAARTFLDIHKQWI